MVRPTSWVITLLWSRLNGGPFSAGHEIQCPGINVSYYTAEGSCRILAYSRPSTVHASFGPPPSGSRDAYGSDSSVVATLLRKQLCLI